MSDDRVIVHVKMKAFRDLLKKDKKKKKKPRLYLLEICSIGLTNPVLDIRLKGLGVEEVWDFWIFFFFLRCSFVFQLVIKTVFSTFIFF